jgi:DNA-nicking Smr family endonuclease
MRTSPTMTPCEPPVCDDAQNELCDDEPVSLPIDGVLDLHTFSPRDLPDLLEDYIAACLERGIFELRIIHGKGKGILRDRVRSILSKHPRVRNFSQAPLEAGGWGATVVTLTDPAAPTPK